MSSHTRLRFLLLGFLHSLQLASCRDWTDCVDQSVLQNDGMPRVKPPRTKDTTTNALSHVMAEDVEIEMHGTKTTLFEEVDPFRITSEPSSAPSYPPSAAPSANPSDPPTNAPTASPTTSAAPTAAPTKRPTRTPTEMPTFTAADEPNNPKEGYFNYDPQSRYGPSRWKNIDSIEEGDPGYFWHTFDLDEDEAEPDNDCGSGKKQSPIDVCVKPEESCEEHHEMRPKSGDYEMSGDLITKQFLPNKLRLVMAPRTGEEPDPPHIDFASNGGGMRDMTNIDFKFPSEHTVCGQRFDGEMQYFAYSPARKRFMAVSFFLDASEDNPRNEHLQEVINEFRTLYKEDERKCEERNNPTSASSFASKFGGRLLYSEDNGLNATVLESEREVTQQRRLAVKWHPFHPDIQKTVHFWGYSGSLTDPPCTRGKVDWRIFDVPTPISVKQLQQFKHLLFTHVDSKCQQTSVHNADGSVARPIQDPSPYYKCTRDNYVSDEERLVCGDYGCDDPFGAGLNPYYPPLVDATGPPTRSPST
ncbi:hypothetical protein ACHAXT_004307 [Thalassiosira profunda]